MSHKNKVSLVDQVKLALDEKLAIGQSKYLDKSLNQTSDKIYSWETYHNYLKHNCYFALWCKENYKCKTLEQCRSHANEWISSRSHLSAYTIKLVAAALAKLFSIPIHMLFTIIQDLTSNRGSCCSKMMRH